MDDKKAVEEIVENNKVEEPEVNKKGKFFSRLKEKHDKKVEEKLEEFKKEDVKNKEVVEEKLEEVYKDIDQLEKTKLSVKQYSKRYEAYALFAWIALASLLLEFLLRTTI